MSEKDGFHKEFKTILITIRRQSEKRAATKLEMSKTLKILQYSVKNEKKRFSYLKQKTQGDSG
jgi:hypothetical protein